MIRIFKPRSLRSAIGFSFIFTLMAKVVGYSRQWLLAYCFGVGRQVDIYMMAFGIAMLSIFPFTLWFDQIVLPRLVITREKEGDAAFRKLCAGSFSLSVVMALTLGILFLLWIPLASFLLSHGFSSIERAGVRRVAFFFIPWVLVIFPYNALSAILKSLRYYDAVMTADFVVSLTATSGFALWHHDLIALPLSLAAGYLLSTLGLAWQARHFTSFLRRPWSTEMKPVFKDFSKMLFVFPVGFLYSSIDRLFQSYLAPGAIAACGYAGQLVAPTFELLAFDEAFIVPLSSVEGRDQKIHRLLAGLILLTIPLVFFLIWKAPEVVTLLFQYGHFDLHARDLTCSVFRILAVTLCTSTLTTPLIRLLQISGRVIQTSYISAVAAVLVFSLNFLFVHKLHWLIIGTTASSALSTVAALLFSVIVVKKAGYAIELGRLSRYIAWALTASTLALFIAHVAAHVGSTPMLDLIRLIVEGLAFCSVLTLFYWPVRSQIRFILYG